MSSPIAILIELSFVSPFFERRFVPLSIILLLVMVMAQFASMKEENQANDEGFHLLTGYRYLKTGTLPLGNEHPPLAGMIAAFPLLFLDLRNRAN